MKDNKQFLNAIGDEEKRNIIQYCMTDAKSVFDIRHCCGIPQTNAYRKLKELIKDDIISIDHHELNRNMYTAYYKTRSDYFIIEMGKDKIDVLEGKYAKM